MYKTNCALAQPWLERGGGWALKADTQLFVQKLLTAVGRAPKSLLLLDYDGTLAPFRRNRDEAVPYAGVALLLSEIAANGHTRVVIVSGRDAQETVPLLGMEPAPEIWGLHGLQRRRPDGSTEIVPIKQRYREALASAQDWLQAQHLNDATEIKFGSVAVHWRGLDDEMGKEIHRRVLEGWRPIADRSGLGILEFEGGLEIRVPSVDKGDVVWLLLSEMEQGVPVAYLGDDNTDEAGFKAIAGKGLGILVRPRWRPTNAVAWLRPPEEVIEFLMQWRKAANGKDHKEEPATARCR